MLIPTETATVLARRAVGTDELNAEISEWVPEGIADVVVAPDAGDEVTESNRPEGTSASLTLHFPETWTGSLRGRRVWLRGREWEVLGDPEPYTEGCLGLNRPVRVRRVEG